MADARPQNRGDGATERALEAFSQRTYEFPENIIFAAEPLESKLCSRCPLINGSGKCDEVKPLQDLRLCVITPPFIKTTGPFYHQVEESLAAGVRFIQFRNKQFSKREAFKIALKLKDLCNHYHCLFLINDDIDLALASHADGVHLGQDDFPAGLARKVLGKDKIIGVSAHQIEQAVLAEKEGADYIGFGSIFPTRTKEKTVLAGLESLKKTCEAVSIPVFAIGGISLSTVSVVLEKGAFGVAVISAVWKQESIGDAVRKLRKQIHSGTQQTIS